MISSKYVLKDLSEIEVIDYEIKAGNKTLYKGFDKTEADVLYKELVIAGRKPQHIYQRRLLGNVFDLKKKLNDVITELVKIVPEEIGQIILAQGFYPYETEPEKLAAAVQKYPSYFKVIRG